MSKPRCVLIAVLLAAVLVAVRSQVCPASASEAQEEVGMSTLFVKPADLMENVPESFPRFQFPGHASEAQLLSRYLWYHFSTRLGNGKTLFNKEYLTCADLWAAGAIDKQRKKPIQEVHREDILGMRLDDEGYVFSHQHFSHAHEHGWPFPLWTQADLGPDKVADKTAGWHFSSKLPDWEWIAGYLNKWGKPQYQGETATQGWELDNCESMGIVDEKWQIESTGISPAITTPAGMEIEAFQSPFLQLRWTRDPQPATHSLPYVEWMREGDSSFGDDRRVYFQYKHANPSEDLSAVSGTKHCLIEMYRHPKWTGKIKRMRICLAPGESDVKFAIDSFFTCYDTRHTINNPIFIFASWNYFRWSGDLDFLRANINRMRTALRYQQTEMGGLKYKHIRNTWVGHDALPGFINNPDGSKTVRGGHGIGSNYWDLLPFGWDDMYATNQYYAATLVMADIEEAILANPGWNMPRGSLALDPIFLRKHAEEVKKTANRKFWDDKKGRFIGCIDSEGKPYDYGFTFLNLDAIWYGIASDEHAKEIMEWISGKRVVAGDTSTGADIYRWRLGPRATTKRNLDWYEFAWYSPESIAWGEQVEDGGAVLGFSFYDLWARLHVYGPDDAWARLAEVLDWEKDVWAAGGYREFYKDGKQGTTLQGGGTAGGIGVDAEFFESSLLPSIVVYGLLGLDPRPTELAIRPMLPKQCPEMGVSDVLYHGSRLDVRASDTRITLLLKDHAPNPIRIRLADDWRLKGATGPVFELTEPGVYEFERRQ